MDKTSHAPHLEPITRPLLYLRDSDEDAHIVWQVEQDGARWREITAQAQESDLPLLASGRKSIADLPNITEPWHSASLRTQYGRKPYAVNRTYACMCVDRLYACMREDLGYTDIPKDVK